MIRRLVVVVTVALGAVVASPLAHANWHWTG
jgi:predicted acyltransferase